MDIRLGPLRVRRIAAKAGEPALTVVLMHGYGAPGDDLVGLAAEIDAPPGTTFLFPEAPDAIAEAAFAPELAHARAWWPIDVGRYERASRSGGVEALVNDVPAKLAQAREALERMLDAVEQDPSTAGTRLVLGGFSQGAMLATDVALRSTRALAGLVVLSGTVLAEREWLPLMPSRKELPVFQSHGRGDGILPFEIAERLRASLQSAGLDVSFTPFEGGHGIPPSVMSALGPWLRSLTSRR